MGTPTSPALHLALTSMRAFTEDGTHYLDDFLPSSLSPRDHWTASP